MSRTQLGLRLSEPEATALRAAASERRMTLGELVTTLLRESRADAGAGIWLDLDEATTRALKAVAGGTGATPERVLQGLVGTWLDSELAYLLERLDDEIGRGPSKLAELLRSREPAEAAEPEQAPPDDEDEPAAVEFTVSMD